MEAEDEPRVDRAEVERLAHELAAAGAAGTSSGLTADLAARVRRALLALDEENRRLLGHKRAVADGETRAQERTAELDQERLRLDVLVEQLPTAVFMVDTVGEITRANAHAIELFKAAGVPLQEGRTYSELAVRRPGGQPYEPGERPLDRALGAGEEVASELVYLRLPNGILRPLDVSAAPLRDREGTIVGAVESASDASERETRGRAEREFVANASHQLRNPVAAIRSAIEVLQSGAKDDEGTRDRFLNHIERESARLTRLTRSLLLLARSQSLVEVPRREVVALGPLLHDVAARINAPDGVTVEVVSTFDQATLVNPDLLEEALNSLADNAVRHAGGRVVIASERRNGAIAVEVRDTGPGIPEAVQQRMFERFHGGYGSGFGLGLAIASQAAEAIGAALEIESGPESGTIARLTLPAVQMLSE